jgi:hypothetical protein
VDDSEDSTEYPKDFDARMTRKAMEMFDVLKRINAEEKKKNVEDTLKYVKKALKKRNMVCTSFLDFSFFC